MSARLFFFSLGGYSDAFLEECFSFLSETSAAMAAFSSSHRTLKDDSVPLRQRDFLPTGYAWPLRTGFLVEVHR